VATERRWFVEDVPACFAPIAELADKHGYVACLFGSVVKSGEGRDLDVMMVSRFRQSQDYHKFLAEFGGTVERTFQRPERLNHSYEVSKDGRLYHFIFGRF